MLRSTVIATAILALATSPALALERQSHDARAVTIDGVLGMLEIAVDASATQVTVEAEGPQRWLDALRLERSSDRLELVQKDRPNRISGKDDWITVRMTVPAGTALTVSDHVGDGRIGDLAGPLKITALHSGDLQIGRVTVLELGISGSGDISVAAADTARVRISGSGDVTLGDIGGDLSVSISGSGDARMGRTTGSVDLSIAGSGDIRVAEVTGPVTASISGSGNIAIDGGTIDPLSVSIAGSGDVQVKADVRNQTIQNSGSGRVAIGGNGR